MHVPHDSKRSLGARRDEADMEDLVAGGLTEVVLAALTGRPVAVGMAHR
jgi:hypothetical protein